MRCGSKRRCGTQSTNLTAERALSVFTAAIFDMDGLLLDSERVIMQAWMEAAQEQGLMLSRADFLQVVGYGTRESHARLSTLLGGEASFRLVLDRARAKLGAHSGVVFPLKPGALTLLQQLRARGVPCAVASSTNVHEVRRRLAQVGVLALFQAIAGGDEVARSKPDPAVYLLAAERLGVAPECCLGFEDSDHGARAAHAAGLAVVMVPDLKSHDFAAAYMNLFSLEDAMTHIDQWFSERALCLR
jgi:beta-phosphoglucomutase-like phosphatase (HAD superfamily)